MDGALRYPAAALLALLVAGCGTLGEARRDESGGVQTVTLSPEQLRVAEDGVKSMVPNPASARLAKMKALTFAGEEGVQICGHVKFKDNAGAYGAMLPFYLDLREAEGKPVAERGQVGTTASALSKVNFMCRRHRGG